MLRRDGTVVVFGDATKGRALPAGTFVESGRSYATHHTFSRVVDLASTGEAFSALRQDGTVWSWGDAGKGGEMSSSGSGYYSMPQELIYTSYFGFVETVSVAATYFSFCALRTDGSVRCVSW